MALDSTVAGANAESYLSVADADALAAALGLSAWAGKTTQQKETALRRATGQIDAHRFHHPKTFSVTQRLAFPRERDGGTIPEAVKRATISQAEFLAVVGDGDRGKWEGPQAAPVKDAGNGSPLCREAFHHLARYVSRAGSYGE